MHTTHHIILLKESSYKIAHTHSSLFYIHLKHQPTNSSLFGLVMVRSNASVEKQTRKISMHNCLPLFMLLFLSTFGIPPNNTQRYRCRCVFSRYAMLLVRDQRTLNRAILFLHSSPLHSPPPLLTFHSLLLSLKL